MSPDSFDLSNGAVMLRLICALFFIPHIYFKTFGNPPPGIEIFSKAGYKNPLLFMRLAMVVEFTAVAALFLDFYTQYAALLCASLLVAAAATLYVANDKKLIWLWPKGGMEYPVFWSFVCIAVAMLYWQ